MSVTTPAKLLISLLGFDPLGPMTFVKARRAAKLNIFILIQVSRALNWMSSAWPAEVSSVPAPWAQ